MNLMDKKSEKNLLATKEILRILSDIDRENFEIAEKFFDFSKEMDLSLLEGIKFQNLKKYSRSNMSTDWVSKHQEAHSEYFARYVLFLDALGENTACFMLESNMNSMMVIVPFKENLIYAFSLKYSLEDAHAKIVALVATGTNTYTVHRNANLSHGLLDMAKNQPLVCFKAADFCREEYTDAKILLYTSALHCLEPITEITDDNRVLAEKMREGIKSLHKYVLDKKKLNSSSELDMVMIYSFMTYHHDMSLKEGILNQKRFILKDFLHKVLTFISTEYLEKSMDDLLDILNFQRDKDFVLDCLQFVFKEVLGTYKVFQNLTDNINLFLTAIAKKYPKEYVDTMLSTKVYCYNASLCDCYPMMYKILETVNPTAIETYHLNFGKDVLKLVIDTEIRDTKVCKDLIKQYLYGEVSAKCLENFRDKLKDTRSLTNRKLLKACFNCHPDFKKRYLVLKYYQSLNAVWHLSTDFFESYTEFIDALVSENLRLEDRFFCYESVFYHCYDNESITKFKKALVQKMVELHDVNHEEYHICCPNGGDVIIRSVYVDYLDATNQNGENKDYLFEMFKDTSKEVRRAAAEAVSKHREYEPDVLELLNAKKFSVREAGVDILIMWGAGNYKDILEEMSQKEKNAKLLDKINSAFDYDTLETNSSPLLLVETLLRNGRNQKVAWLYNNNLNDSVHLNNSNLAGTDYMQALLLCYAGMDTLGISANATFLAQELNQEELNRFAGDVFSAWLEDGASSKKKWVLYFCAIHGGHNIIEGILHYIKEWAENSRGAIAAEAVRALALNGTSEALMSIDNLAHKCKFKQVKNAAMQALESAADDLGITSDELGDRIIPDLGFNQGMERIFDYGTRQFKVYLTPTLELEVYDENDKKLKNIPAPSKKDNPEIAKKSNDDFKQMKKQLKSIVNIQKVRLETALLADRRWSFDAWTNLFVKNPIMHSFAIGLVWAAYEDDKPIQTFRYMEDGSFNTADEDEYEIPENCTIGLVHPIDLSEDELNAWKEQLSDYEIVQPIEQLERPIYRVHEDEIGKFEVLRYKDKKIKAIKLLSHMTKLGWYKGSVQDAGFFYSFYREDITKRVKEKDTVTLLGNAVELNFSGMYVAAYGYDDNDDVEIESIRFYRPGSVERGSYVYDEPDDTRSFKLETVNPRYFSEILAQLENLVKKADDE